MVAFVPPDIRVLPLKEAINKVRTVPADNKFMESPSRWASTWDAVVKVLRKHHHQTRTATFEEDYEQY